MTPGRRGQRVGQPTVCDGSEVLLLVGALHELIDAGDEGLQSPTRVSPSTPRGSDSDLTRLP